MKGGGGGCDGFGLHPQGLIQAAHQVRSEAAGKTRARHAQHVTDAAETKARKAFGGFRFDTERGDRERAERLSRFAGFRDPLRCRVGCRRGWWGGSALGPVALAGPRTCGACLLIDRIATARGPCGAGPAEPRQCPGGPCGIRDAGPHGEAQIGAIGRHLGKKRLLPPEKMRTAREIDHQPLGRSLRHPGAELPSPAAQRGQESRLPGRVRDAGNEIGAERDGLAQRLAPMEAPRLGQGIQCADLAKVADLRDHGKRGLGQTRLTPQHPVRGKARKPERQDAAGPRVRAVRGS
jgi:hypothetical protein